MRLLNELIYALIFLVLFASARLFGQTQGNAISLIDSANNGENNSGLLCGVGGNCFQYPESLSVGDVLVIAAGQFSQGACGGAVQNPNPPWPVTDSLSNTITTQTATSSTDTLNYVQMSCMAVTNPGTDQITVTGLDTNTGCPSTIAISRFKNASCNLDGSIQSAGSGTGAAPQTMSTSTTTTVNGVALVSAGIKARGVSATPRPSGALAQYSTFAGVNIGGDADVLMEFALPGNIGTYSMGMDTCCGTASAGANSIMQTIALKPATTIAIGDTALPDAAASIAYSAQLHCIGGTVAPTFALVSGSFPAGISLNTATGLISGSTSSTGTSTLGFTCTGGSTSPTQTLTLKVGAGFNSIIVKSTSTFNGDIQPNSTSPVNAACGDLIIICTNGADTHHGIGWMPATSGLNSFWSDSFGSPVQRFIINSGMTAAPMACYEFGPLLASGGDVISYQNNGGGSAGLPPALEVVVSGAQGVLDVGALKTSTANPIASIAQSLTTLVPNEYVLASTVIDDTAGSISVAAPFSLIASGNDGGFGFKAFASATVSSPSTVTATQTLTGSPATASTLLMGLRPALPSACSFTGAGEKKRRAMN